MDPVEIYGGRSIKIGRISAGVVPYARATERHSAGKVVVLGGGAPALIEKGDAAFTPEVNVTATLVAGPNGNLNEIAVASGFTTGLAASRNITVKDLSGYDYIRCLIKSSIAQAAGDLQIGVSETAGMGGSPNWSDLPAMEANKWYLVSVAFTGAGSTRNATLSVGLKVITDSGAFSAFIGDISAGANFNGISGFADDNAVVSTDFAPVDEYASGKDVPIIVQGLALAKLAAGVTALADQRLYPLPGGELTTTVINQPGPAIFAKEDQATAAGRVAILL